jgi:hypothetical protein
MSTIYFSNGIRVSGDNTHTIQFTHLILPSNISEALEVSEC